MGGGTKVTLTGGQFLPFDWKEDINNQNDTFCHWGPLGKTPAMVLSSTQAECLSPENNLHLDWAPVNLTLNNQNYTDEHIEFHYFNPPNIVDAEPLLGPVKGGTVVHFYGSKFEKKNITCLFEKDKDQHKVYGEYIMKTHILCKSPEVLAPGDYKLIVKYTNDRFQSDVLNYRYFDSPEMTDGPILPSCGPTEGFTQITIRGKNFIE